MSKKTIVPSARAPRKGTQRIPEPAAPATPPTAKEPGGKIGLVVGLMRRPGGATLADLITATGWQAHSVRGAIAGAIKKTRGLAVISAKSEAGRVYRIEAADDAA
jgi:hypothetical protein